MSSATQNYPLKIRQLLQKNTVMSLKQLRHVLNDRPRSSLFRDLKKLDLISSYTHTGQYHALERAARFDQNGLWFFQEVGFSQYGTLKKTLVHRITHSPTGMTHKEMKKLFRIEVQKPLTDLVKTNAVTRQLLPSHIYVYLSADQKQAEDQFQRRLTIADSTSAMTLPPESIQIEILVEVIHAPKRTRDEKVLGPLLRKRGVIIRDDEIVYVLAYYDIKKTDFEIVQLTCRKVSQLRLSMSSAYLFPQRPTLYFYAKKICHCGVATTVRKTSRKTITTLDVGEFEAIETQTVCRHCQQIYESNELRSLTPHRGKFGFDVIEYIGKALFVHCHNELEIQAELARRNIPICVREIGFLGKRFIVYLALAHQECQAELKQYMQSKGGYILHMDGTCEGDSPHLFSCMDEISRIVLGNRKMPAEDSQHIVPLLQSLKAAYGTPIAMVHDMGSAILKAVSAVFPGVADYICHFHFLRDLGKDLFDFEYRTIRRYTRSYGVRAKLNKTSKQLQAAIRNDKRLWDSLENYLTDNERGGATDRLYPQVTAYLLVAWILEAASACHGFGFPFDQPHLEFYLRLQEAYPALKRLKEKGVSVLPLMTLSRVLTDGALKKLVSRMQEKVSIFEELRQAMRIARVEHHQGLNDEGDEDIKTIESRVKRFRHCAKIVKLAASDTSYHKMVKQIDRYWDKLFADPIEVDTPTGKMTIQPQRTNNLMEQSFRFLKRDGRKRSGQHSLNKTLKGMLADTPLVRNLANPDYVAILLKGKKHLAECFAAIDIQQVRREEKENEERWRKYPKSMAKIFKIAHLPQKLMKTAAK